MVKPREVGGLQRAPTDVCDVVMCHGRRRGSAPEPTVGHLIRTTQPADGLRMRRRRLEGAGAMEDAGGRPGSSEFGALLRRYRPAAGLSQETLAERARVSLDGISALERGYRRTPQRETLALLAGALALNDDQREAFEAAAARPRLPRRRGEGSVTVGPWPGAESASLPFSLTRFIGRDADLDQIRLLVRESDAAVRRTSGSE
jgi:transcriptional regulator with XRE-family HTH domain